MAAEMRMRCPVLVTLESPEILKTHCCSSYVLVSYLWKASWAIIMQVRLKSAVPFYWRSESLPHMTLLTRFPFAWHLPSQLWIRVFNFCLLRITVLVFTGKDEVGQCKGGGGVTYWAAFSPFYSSLELPGGHPAVNMSGSRTFCIKNSALIFPLVFIFPLNKEGFCTPWSGFQNSSANNLFIDSFCSYN